MTLKIPVSAKNGSFSRMLTPNARKLNFWMRCKGQQSSNTKAHGSVTNIGFDMSQRANRANASTYHLKAGVRGLKLGASAKRTYAQRASIKKKPHNTSSRSDIHETDTTCNGCSAHNDATNGP